MEANYTSILDDMQAQLNNLSKNRGELFKNFDHFIKKHDNRDVVKIFGDLVDLLIAIRSQTQTLDQRERKRRVMQVFGFTAEFMKRSEELNSGINQEFVNDKVDKDKIHQKIDKIIENDLKTSKSFMADELLVTKKDFNQLFGYYARELQIDIKLFE